MATQWIPPLPPGFEARWDPTQRAYFFIDHTNKTTTWQDPRFPPSGPVPPPVTHQAAAQSLNQGAGLRPTGGATAGQKVPMSMKSRQVGATTTIESSDSSSSEEEEENFDNLFASSTDKTSEGSEFQKKVKEILTEFPTAPESAVAELLRSNNNITARVKNKLFDKGYKRVTKADNVIPDKKAPVQTVWMQEEKVDLMKLHQLRQSFPSAPEDVIQQLLKSHHNNTVRVSNALHEMGYKRAEAVSHPEPRRVDILERVRAMYPDTDKEVIDSVFKSCEGDERTMRQVLDRMGYKPKFPETHRNPSAKGERSTSPAKGKVPMKPAQRETTPKKQESPAKVAPPAEPELSIGQKSQLVSKLQSLYKDLEKSVIEMACEVCKWDETRAKNVLELMKDDMSRPVTSTSRPTTSQTQRSPSPSPAPLSPASLEPVSMMHDEPSRPGTSTSSASSKTYMKASDFTSRASSATGTKVSIQKPAQGKYTGSQSKSNVATTGSQSKSQVSTTGSQSKSHIAMSSSSQQTRLNTGVSAASSPTTQHTRAKQVTQPGPKQPVVSQQPQRPAYISANRTKAKGPDPSLHVGPNKGLLLTDYTKANGPNPELRQGPDPGRVHGSQGAVGPDRSLSCGPQHHLVHGPNTDLRQVAYV
ncbi:uncharacterized protein LOC127837398 isoform X21 [Dreissena polymorpha]|uniref:uncharacterized protein LOC127837398 isoform X1 n=1 Tax=Dreissena polymorpha TaxID=45954 RepID=UPI0022647B27|nr:uncharacterized protein LOC127837398 isoform X1 [Dreissena polymorpha]XP_052220361.1 uncharacterized protein LOC127837398 isoform X2 [Dreissena polymorpha]XP_052220362.1 uncharacterized protein LOC127837398 isoform X3 [Dreissena polymorpha]XP_052220363.1 uncharacterized protein LOC127837398 isoform X4 [Dreissena polymorpha]XP_052220364.1 uncharacterized protein LOC127837398 isoform X5 [Dreissena polymorpha]XP_052220365.1 uncharacterized protein LOC127837398 isoform X6 [Dreissena polymorpha]